MDQRAEFEERFDLTIFWHLFRRSWWLVILGMLIGGSLGYGISKLETPQYSASAKILVQGARSPGTPSSGDLDVNRQLASSFSALITTRPVLNSVREDLRLPFSAEVFKEKVTTTVGGSLIDIAVTDPDPALAADIANQLATNFISIFETRQLTQIAQFQASLGQFGIDQTASIVAAQAATLSTLSLVEEAIPPGSPVSPKTRINVMLGIVIGLLVTGALSVARVYVDDTIKTGVELFRQTGIVDIGSVGRIRTPKGVQPIMPVRDTKGMDIAEGYRFIQTSLDFARLQAHELRTVLITSAGPGEGKTTTATNLAISAASQGRSVILVDTDLRRPSVHTVLGIASGPGLTDHLLGQATLQEVLRKTDHAGLSVIATGPLPPDASALFRSSAMEAFLKEIRDQADLILFDSSPVLAVVDPIILARLMDGVVLVAAANQTRRVSLVRAADQLQQVGAVLLGAVTNKARSDSALGYNYYYYRYGEDGHEPTSGAPALWRKVKKAVKLGS